MVSLEFGVKICTSHSQQQIMIHFKVFINIMFASHLCTLVCSYVHMQTNSNIHLCTRTHTQTHILYCLNLLAASINTWRLRSPTSPYSLI